MRKISLAVLLAFVLLDLLVAPADAAEVCFKCHSDRKLNQRLSGGLNRGLEVGLDALKQSVHADVGCTDCHTQLADVDASKGHKPKIGPPTGCSTCHDAAFKAYTGSVHGTAAKRGDRDVAHCADCHGGHDIVKVKAFDSRVAKARLPFTCAKCHQNTELAKQHGIHQGKAASQYMESIHGRGLLKMGLVVAPSCTDCHDSHAIYRHEDSRSLISHRRVPETCGKCHVGINETYQKSVHGQLLARKDPRGPVCVDCHTAHQISSPTTRKFHLDADEKCGKCHIDRLARYRETYHGKAQALGLGKVAACFDCHGHHDILPISDPRSYLSPQRKLATCQKCHPQATEKFTGYIAHADHTDRKGNPTLYWTYVLMTGLLLGVFGFFGFHTLLWLARSIALFARNPKAFREAKERLRAETGRTFVRFRPVDRFTHFLVILSFLLLVLTGMPLKFYYTDWARWMFGWMGGAGVAAALHRFGAFITGLYFAIHIVRMVGALWRNRTLYRTPSGHFSLRRMLRFVFGPDSPMPNLQDLRDFWAHQKYFFGRGPQPQFDRWTYWEKFDYLAVFWGVAVIGLSGLILWFPTTFTRWLPGWWINIALIIHSDEALLAAGFIFTFHFFNVHFRLEKFPMDPVIFSGRVSEAEMLHERKRLYDRLQSEGRLEKELLKDEWGLWKRIFNPIGMLAFSIGVALIVAIYWAMASRLLH